MLTARIAELEAELAVVRARLNVLIDRTVEGASACGITSASSPADKLALFRQRFAGRDDVYAVRWTSKKTGKSGWSPAVRGGFYRGDESDADHLSLTDDVVERHLRGGSDYHVGLYPMIADDMCRLLVCDFDDESWRHDAAAYANECRRAGLQVLAEISRSGEGAHVWLFFNEAVPAATARVAGLGLLHAAMARVPGMSFASYDRFFPSQDTLPERSTGRGRLGNLIALPLQGDCRRRATSVFADPETWQPFGDQFAALAACAPATFAQLNELATSLATPRVGPSHMLARRPKRATIRASAKVMAGQKLTVRRDSMVHVPTAALPSAVVTELKHMASVANPEFYRKQAQRFSTFGTPRFVTCFEHDEGELRLPRGLSDEAVTLLNDAGFTVSVDIDRRAHHAIDIEFTGELRPSQQSAVDALLAHDMGVLVAPPGSGKTVIACALIAHRRVPSAILVNRADLVVQWRERLQQFLSLEEKQIGQLGAGRRKRRLTVDIIMMQSIGHRAGDPSILEDYGQLIVDECHGVAAPAIEAALRQVDVPLWTGLTATPYRADQLDGLITMQCGPIRHEIEQAVHGTRRLIVHDTVFTTGSDGASIQVIYSELAADTSRNETIIGHIVDAAESSRTCLVLTSRLEHLDALASGVTSRCGIEVVSLHGRLSPAQRREIRARLTALDDAGTPFVLVAIDKIAGEGLDLPTLDTLFLTVPVSFKGRVIQQIGRVTRGTESAAIVHDYRDSAVPVLERMHRRRRAVMAKEGFEEMS